ncbi:MAG: AEC family transporter, partial [Solirubrobacterales bacterium]
PMIPIALTILAATWIGLRAEHRFPGRAGTGSRGALTLVLYTVLPLVVFFNLARAELDGDFAVGVVLAWIAVAICTGLAYLVGSRILRLRREQTGALLCCVLVANTGYLGYPLVGATLGFDRIGEAVVYDVLVSGSTLLIGAFSVGAAFGTRAGEGGWQRVRAFFTRNVPLYAAAFGLLAPASFAPDIAVDISRVAIVALLPLGFFAVGAALAEDEERGEVRLPPTLTKPVATAVAVKVMLMPALLFALATPLIDLPTTFLVLAAMPSGLNSMVIAHAYGLDLKIIAGALVWTTGLVVPVALVASLV